VVRLRIQLPSPESLGPGMYRSNAFQSGRVRRTYVKFSVNLKKHLQQLINPCCRELTARIDVIALNSRNSSALPVQTETNDLTEQYQEVME
jgi:hypothetical protein